jgi:succinoglycan biosynthesis transport protein ExoP
MNIHLNSASGSPASQHCSAQSGPDWQTNDIDSMDKQEWTAIECLRTLYKRKAALVYMVGASIVAAGLISLGQPRWYRSEASLEVQGINENFLSTRDIYPTLASGVDSSGTYVQTQAEILQQDALIEQVVRKLHLNTRPDFQRSPGLWDKFRWLSGPGSASVPDVHNAADIVKENVKIVPSRASRILRIVCDARDPQVAADLANALAQTFIEQSIEARHHVAQQTLVALSLQLAEIRNKLLRSESQLAAVGRGLTFGIHPQRSFTGGPSLTAESTAYNTLKRDVESDRRFYDTMSQRVNDARVAAAVRQSNIGFVGPAQPAAYPYKPNLPLNLAIGMAGGLIVAIGWAMLQEQTNSFLRRPGEAGLYLTLPELGAIPQVPNLDIHGLSLQRTNNEDLRVERAAREQELSGLSESFRATLASILSTGRNRDRAHILLVTSAQPMEGKTTVVSNLAIGLAEIGSKVLLIDGDMRRPRLHKMFDQANSWGLSDVLREKNAIEELPLDALIKKTAVPGVYLLPSGVCADNIFGLLWSGRLARLLPRFREEFDYVLLDAPPCLEFADARIMARHTDQLLLVVRANYTDKRTAQVAVQRLLEDGIPVMGVILNRCDPAHSDMYRYAFHSGLNRQGLA